MHVQQRVGFEAPVKMYYIDDLCPHDVKDVWYNLFQSLLTHVMLVRLQVHRFQIEHNIRGHDRPAARELYYFRIDDYREGWTNDFS